MLGAASGAALAEESDALSPTGFNSNRESVTGRFHPYGSGYSRDWWSSDGDGEGEMTDRRNIFCTAAQNCKP